MCKMTQSVAYIPRSDLATTTEEQYLNRVITNSWSKLNSIYSCSITRMIQMIIMKSSCPRSTSFRVVTLDAKWLVLPMSSSAFLRRFSFCGDLFLVSAWARNYCFSNWPALSGSSALYIRWNTQILGSVNGCVISWHPYLPRPDPISPSAIDIMKQSRSLCSFTIA